MLVRLIGDDTKLGVFGGDPDAPTRQKTDVSGPSSGVASMVYLRACDRRGDTAYVQ